MAGGSIMAFEKDGRIHLTYKASVGKKRITVAKRSVPAGDFAALQAEVEATLETLRGGRTMLGRVNE